MSNEQFSQHRSSIMLRTWNLSEFLVADSFIGESLNKPRSLSHMKEFRFSSSMRLDLLLDLLGSQQRWHCGRTDVHTLIMAGESSMIQIVGTQKSGTCTCECSIWGSSVESIRSSENAILDLVGQTLKTTRMFSLKWYFYEGDHLENIVIEEEADDKILDSAYPSLLDGVHKFVSGYLASEAAILVLQGPPGTGKTRLIREILGQMSVNKGENALVCYTSDTALLESDLFLMKFIKGNADALVMEDADHILQPRSNGNANLHRLLVVADGVARAKGRKLIFSTNLPNLGDLDDALLRPGRCYARMVLPELSPVQAKKFIAEYFVDDGPMEGAATESLLEPGMRSYSLADVYQVIEKVGLERSPSLAASSLKTEIDSD